ncbi:MAG: serine hydrolase domain-containing protein [Planctomycetota bacterium]|nr:serine hydrolase domain-containing protein [Planctomycetota bacterium]
MKSNQQDRRRILKTGVALLASGTPAAAQSERRGAESLPGKADLLLRKAVAEGGIPGVVAMATNRDRAIYQGAFGQRVLGQNAAMTTDTVVWIASMTKVLVSAAAMQLVEQGKLDLDGPATRWVSELSRVQVLVGWDGNGEPRTRAPKRPITLRHLLTHTSGFSYDLWNADIGRYQEVTKLPGIGSGQYAALFAPLVADPGERWEYGISIDWVGKIIEAVSGKTLGAYLQDHLFDPLEMTSTAFKLTPTMRNRMAKIHQRGDNGKLVVSDFSLPEDPEFQSGGGGLYSTAGDYLRFIRMILNRGKLSGNQVLKPETVDLMSRNAMGDTKVTLLKTVIPTLSNDAEFFPGMPKTWGLGFMINEQAAPNGRSAGSLAWAGLANTYFWIDPDKGLGGVYLTQILPFADTKSLPLFSAFENLVYQAQA